MVQDTTSSRKKKMRCPSHSFSSHFLERVNKKSFRELSAEEGGGAQAAHAGTYAIGEARFGSPAVGPRRARAASQTQLSPLRYRLRWYGAIRIGPGPEELTFHTGMRSPCRFTQALPYPTHVMYVSMYVKSTLFQIGRQVGGQLRMRPKSCMHLC